jgi:hypothetical protein
MATLKIRTEYQVKPIPLRGFDWEAVLDNYEQGCPVGFGSTEQEAIADLLTQIDDDGMYQPVFDFWSQRTKRQSGTRSETP